MGQFEFGTGHFKFQTRYPTANNLSSALRQITRDLSRLNVRMPQLTRDLSQITREMPRLNVRMPQLTRDLSQITREMPRLNGEMPQLTRDLSRMKRSGGLTCNNSPRFYTHRCTSPARLSVA